MNDHTVVVDESQRQMMLLALAQLSIQRPGWDMALNELAVKMDNVVEGRAQMYDEFRRIATAAGKTLTLEQLRDFIIRAHGMATENYVQSDTEMRKRIGALMESAIQQDSVMSGFLGRGGPAAHCDAMGPTPSCDPRVKQMILHAWVGEDELGSGEVGIKAGRVPAGCIPLVACKEGKVDEQYIVNQMRAQGAQYGKVIRLVRFVYHSVEIELIPPNLN